MVVAAAARILGRISAWLGLDLMDHEGDL